MQHNLLTGSLPVSANIHGREFPISTDFRALIELEKLILDGKQDKRTRITRIMRTMYPEAVPADIEVAFDEVLFIYSCGNPPVKNAKADKKKKNGEIDIKEKMIYDYEFDAPYIYGAFLSQYGIDLQDVDYLHWWKFQALFKSLPSTQKIVEIMGYRATDTSKIKDAKERARIIRLQQVYALPNNMTPEEKVAMAGAAFSGGFTR